MAISGRQLRFRRGLPVIQLCTARLPRRFAPRNDTSGSAAVHQRPPAVEWLCTRRSVTALQTVGFAARIRWRKVNKFVIARPQRGRGNLGKAVAISPGVPCYPAGYCEIAPQGHFLALRAQGATSPFGLPAMTNLGALRRRMCAAVIVNLQGAQGAPLQAALEIRAKNAPIRSDGGACI